MIKTAITVSGNTLIYDDETLQIQNGIIICNFVNMRCLKTISKKTYTYEYPEVFFKKTKMCHKNDILSENECLGYDLELFNLIRKHSPLSNEDREYIRQNYLKIDNSVNENKSEQMELL